MISPNPATEKTAVLFMGKKQKKSCWKEEIKTQETANRTNSSGTKPSLSDLLILFTPSSSNRTECMHPKRKHTSSLTLLSLSDANPIIKESFAKQLLRSKRQDRPAKAGYPDEPMRVRFSQRRELSGDGL